MIRLIDDSDIDKYQSIFVDLLFDIYNSNFKKNSIDKKYCIDKVEQMKKFHEDGSAIIIGAFDEELIGFAWVYKHFFLNQRRLHINQIAVAKEYRRKGTGRLLLNKIEEIADDLNVDNIDLMVTAANIDVVNFYKNNGFRIERYLMSKN